MLEMIETRIYNQSFINGDTTFLNPFSYLQIRKNRHLAKPMTNIAIDGGLLVLLLRLFMGWKVKRISFDMTSLAPVVFKAAEKTGKKVYLIGSQPGEIEGAVEKISAEFPGMNIVRFRDGYFSDEEREQELILLSSLKPDIVVVGMGTPLQEQFLIDLRSAGWAGTGFTCGGFLHQTAKGIQYYPGWIDKLNLRWMYRIYDEPKLFKRYTLDYTKFLFVFFYDVIRYKLTK